LTRAMHDLALQLSSPTPLSLASDKPANPGSPRTMAVKTERESVHILLLCNVYCSVAEYSADSKYDREQPYVTSRLHTA